MIIEIDFTSCTLVANLVHLFHSLKATVHDRVVHYRCETFRLKSAQVAAEGAAGGQVARYKVHRTEVFTEVFLLAIQNPVDGPRLVVKLFVSVTSSHPL